MISNDKEWILRKLNRLKEEGLKANGKDDKMHDYKGRIRLLNKLIGIVENE